MQITIEPETTEPAARNYWRVSVGDRWAIVGWDEMLGLVASLTMPEGRRPCLQWLKTAAEHYADHARLMERSKQNAAEFITEAREHPGEE